MVKQSSSKEGFSIQPIPVRINRLSEIFPRASPRVDTVGEVEVQLQQFPQRLRHEVAGRPVRCGLLVVHGSESLGVHHLEPVGRQIAVRRVRLAAGEVVEQSQSRVLISVLIPGITFYVEDTSVTLSIDEVYIESNSMGHGDQRIGSDISVNVEKLDTFLLHL